MSTNFPSGLDNFTNPTSGDTLDSPDHAAQHADVNDAVEALQTKVGVDGSAVTGSLDYKVATLETDAVVSDQINEIVKLTQAAYDALTPDANTLYVIVG